MVLGTPRRMTLSCRRKIKGGTARYSWSSSRGGMVLGGGTEPPVPNWPAGKRQREKAKKRKRERAHDLPAPPPLPALPDQQGHDHETSEGQTGDIDAVEEGAAGAAPQEQQSEYYRWTWGQETGWTEIPASSHQPSSQGDGGGAAHAAPSQSAPLPFFSSSPSHKRHMEWMDSMEQSTTAACMD